MQRFATFAQYPFHAEEDEISPVDVEKSQPACRAGNILLILRLSFNRLSGELWMRLSPVLFSIPEIDIVRRRRMQSAFGADDSEGHVIRCGRLAYHGQRLIDHLKERKKEEAGSAEPAPIALTGRNSRPRNSHSGDFESPAFESFCSRHTARPFRTMFESVRAAEPVPLA